MNACISQWIGRRSEQEDAYAVRHFPTGTLAIVCDGMGGHCHGGQAATRAAEAFATAFAEQGGCPMVDRLRGALHAANEAVGELFGQCDSFGGCTLLAAFIGGNVLWWISVGDSPLLLWRRGRLTRLNADHSMRSLYADLVRTGTMTHQEMLRRGNMLRSAVTGESIPLVDAPPTPYPVLPGDKIILCSDGLDDLLLGSTLPPSTRKLLDSRGGNPAALLIEACRAMNTDYADNATAITLDV